jgi:hypothetical protein
MKLRIFTLFLMTFAVSIGATTPKWNLQSYPEFKIDNLFEVVELLKLKVIITDEKLSIKKIKVHLEAKLNGSESNQSVSGIFNVRVLAEHPDEKTLQVILFSRNLSGPCDYNGFQKVSLKFNIDETGEILPNTTETKINVYQRDLNCTDKFQAFVGHYL